MSFYNQQGSSNNKKVESQNKLLIILAILAVIVAILSIFLNERNKYTSFFENNVVKEVDKIQDSNTADKTDINTALSDEIKKNTQDILYTTKSGIKIFYPSSFSYEYINDWGPQVEALRFGFPNNTETLSITSSDSKYFSNNTCDGFDDKTLNYVTTETISNKQILHSIRPDGSEVYCLQTLEYSFVLIRSQANKIKIDVNKILF